MSNQDKPREWTIKNGEVISRKIMDVYDVEYQVIEYSAYQKLESELASLRAELARLKDKDHCYCGYCGKQFAVGDVGWRDLQLHINGCEKHPVYQLDVANTKLRKERDELKSQLNDTKRGYEFELHDKQVDIDELKAKLEAAENLMKASVKEQIEAFAPQILEEERGAFNAEVEQLKHENECLEQNRTSFIRGLLYQIEHLESEAERWQSEASNHARVPDQCAAEKLMLQAEVERLKNLRRREARNDMREEIIKLEAEVERLADENTSLVRDLERKSKEIGRSEHRGNTVDYIYDKCETYGRQVQELANLVSRYRTALEEVSRKRAATIFIETEEHVAHFFEPIDQALASQDKDESNGKND